MPDSYKYVNKLRGASVLVVGGTSGIGFGVAEAALEYGARVIISGTNPEKLRKATSLLQTKFDLMEHGPEAQEPRIQPVGKTCDLADTTKMESNLEQLLLFATDDGQTPLDHVVFTAGDVFETRKLHDIEPEHVIHSFIVRVTAAVVLAKLLLPKYIRHVSASSYTLTGGVNGEKPEVNWTVPASMSYAVEGCMHGLAVDMKPLRVNCVAPGIVNTELLDRIPPDQKEKVMKVFGDATLTGNIGRPEDLAEAYLYCMKDTFLTGSTIKSNGGRLLV